jgi:hypothetical protein
MFNLEQNNPESPNSSPEPQSSTPDQTRRDLELQQKTENDQVNRDHAKNKSETANSSASSRADLMSSIGPSSTENPAPAQSESAPNTPADGAAQQPSTGSFGDKFKNIVDKFKGVFSAISLKFTDFFNNLFNKKPSSSPTADSQNPPNPDVKNQPAPPEQSKKSNEETVDNETTKGLKGEALLNNEKFRARTEQIAAKLGCSVDDLYAIFKMESGANPQAVNTVSKATGLIQWMPKYAPQFGTTTEELFKMTGLQQLDYVEKFFSRYFGKLHNFADLYRAVFWPAAIGKGPDYIFQTSSLSAEIVAKQNPGIAKAAGRPDGYIDNAGFEKYANKFDPKKQALA